CLLTYSCLAVSVLRRRVVWFCHSDVCCFCGELYRWQTGVSGWFYRRLDVYPADATAELRSQHYAMGDLFAGAVHLHWCADYIYRCWLPCEMDEPENPVTGFPVSVQNHIFATDSFRHFCHAGDVLRHHPIWWLDQRRYPYRADCRR